MKVDEITEIAVWDTETTGVDVENDLIVTSFFGIMNAAGEMIERHEWVIDHGIDIPTGASDVHGWTTERVRAEGRKDAGIAIDEIQSMIEWCWITSTPLVIMNASYDLTILDRAIRRQNGGAGLTVPPVIIDPYVIDKALDQYRRGSRKLADMAAHYRIPVGNAHDAEADCVMAGKIALFLLGHSAFKGLTLQEIHDRSIGHARKQRESLKAYFTKSGKHEAAASVTLDWPIIPAGAGQSA